MNFVLKNTCLQRAVEALPRGMDTMINKRSELLTDVLKAKLSLARAIYSNADIYLFDDPFSVMDEETGSEVLDNLKQALAAKCVVHVVTSEHHFGDASSLMILNSDGTAEKYSADENGRFDLSESEIMPSMISNPMFADKSQLKNVFNEINDHAESNRDLQR